MAEERRGDTFVIQGAPNAKPGERPIEFTTFLLGLASSVLIHLGQAANPENGKTEKDLVQARQLVDLLTLLREKTRGNLTTEEDHLFDNLLADVRIRFVDASRT